MLFVAYLLTFFLSFAAILRKKETPRTGRCRPVNIYYLKPEGKVKRMKLRRVMAGFAAVTVMMAGIIPMLALAARSPDRNRGK